MTESREPGDAAAEDVLARCANRRNAFERYRIAGELARGGMGSILKVWDEDLRRELAMKVVLSERTDASSSTDSRERGRLARFLEEAQVTGQLEHPGIVPVHELGCDDAGRAYFTMKLVKGITLAEVFARHRDGDDEWNTTRVLDVLLRACEALAYAHAKGVIHRDLKPPNVMVGAFGEVHVMDWGLARILGQPESSASSAAPSDAPVRGVRSEQRGRTTETSLHTLDGDVLGTPAYMAPEQASGRLGEIGPQADVYAVGAMLYELLAGHPPYLPHASNATQLEVWEAVRRGPPAPLAAQAGRVPLELVAICDKAMARDWHERYPDMSALAADLRAFLERRVVSAYRTGTWAETVKWVQRNRALAASLAAALIVLVVGLVASMALKREADENAARAESNALETRIVADFQSRLIADVPVDEFGRSMVASLRSEVAESLRRDARSPDEITAALTQFDGALVGANPTNAARRVLSEQIFERTLASLEVEYADRPKLKAQLQMPLAKSMWDLGLFELGERTARESLAVLRREAGDRDTDTLSAINMHGLHLRALGRAAEAEPLYREALDGYREVLGPDHPNTLSCMSSLALLLQQLNESEEAERLARESVTRSRAARTDVFQPLVNLASVLEVRGSVEEAQTCLREALDLRREQHASEQPDALTAANNLGLLLLRAGRRDEAEELLRATVASQRGLLGDRHSSTLSAIHNLALVCQAQGKLPEAAALLRETIAGWRATVDPHDSRLLGALRILGVLLINSGRADEAEPCLRETWLGYRATLGDTDRTTLSVESNLEEAVRAQRRLDEAEALAREWTAVRRKALGERDPDTLEAIRALASTLRLAGRPAEAEPFYREALEGLRAVRGEDYVLTLRSRIGLAHVLRARGAFAEAESMLDYVIERGSHARDVPAAVVVEAKQLLRDVCRAWHEREPDGGHGTRADELERELAK
ncbi:MAG: serine/threonine protein kinase [Planctomycetes bacterium]|nr:serine/threonine protein kinase [Planctomycetota bacterium]